MPLPQLKSYIEQLDNEDIDLEHEFADCPSSDYNYVNDWHNSGWIGYFHLDLVLSYAIQELASDVHIAGNQEVCFTVLGDIIKKPQFAIADDETMEDLVIALMTNETYGHYTKDLEADFTYRVKVGPYRNRRFRVNVGKSLGTHQMTMRTINETIPSLSELGIDNSVYNLFQKQTGICLVCGPTGSGKSSTLASIMREIQLTKRKKIVAVEKPVEFIYPTDGLGVIVQRSVPDDCLSFEDGLTSAMRSAPNIILIGEVRNKGEVDELLRASETGHLSVSTIHTSNNVTTLNRIRSLYEGNEQRRILSTLGDNLRAIINQILVKSIDGNSRFAVREVLFVDTRIRNLIQEDNFSAIRELQEQSESTMEHSLLNLVIQGKCTLSEARNKAPDVAYFETLYNHKIKEQD